MADGITDAVVCFDQGGGATCYAHVHARVRRCPGKPGEGEFWIWQLPSVAHCSAAYCTTLAQ